MSAATQALKCFLVFVPFFVLAVYSGSIYDDLRTNEVPGTVPAVQLTRVGQGITAVIVSEKFWFSEKDELCWLIAVLVYFV